MALNPNHTFEDLGEWKCSIVEKNCSPGRVSFLKKLMEHNGFTVIVVNTPSKAPAKPVAAVNAEVSVAEPSAPETFTVGVTDLTFNPINAIFNRELKSFEGHVVCPDYWKQKHPQKEKWYWEK